MSGSVHITPGAFVHDYIDHTPSQFSMNCFPIIEGAHVCNTLMPYNYICLVKKVQDLENQVRELTIQVHELQSIGEKFEALHDMLREISRQQQEQEKLELDARE